MKAIVKFNQNCIQLWQVFGTLINKNIFINFSKYATKKMESTDYLSMKTTNINIRISPILKSQLIERGGKMGINLSDYIGHALTKDMSGQNDPKQSEEYKELIRRFNKLKEELTKYEAVGEPFKQLLGKDTTINGKVHRFEHPSEILNYFANTFKLK